MAQLVIACPVHLDGLDINVTYNVLQLVRTNVIRFLVTVMAALKDVLDLTAQNHVQKPVLVVVNRLTAYVRDVSQGDMVHTVANLAWDVLSVQWERVINRVESVLFQAKVIMINN